MLRKKLIPVWAAIIILVSMYLMGQGWSPPSDPCNPDPCASITNAVAETCVDLGDGDFTCDCDAGFAWEDATDTCEEFQCGFPAPVQRTGQTTSYATGDDGDLEKGVAWPDPRFTDNGDGTVTDNLTGLIWTKNANCDGTKLWLDAVDYCNTLADGICGLTDGSIAGDWRLPNVRELHSLIHYGYFNPSLPNTAGNGQWTAEDPFANVLTDWYWSSATSAHDTDYAWFVNFYYGSVSQHDKDGSHHAWCVRGGE